MLLFESPKVNKYDGINCHIKNDNIQKNTNTLSKYKFFIKVFKKIQEITPGNNNRDYIR